MNRTSSSVLIAGSLGVGHIAKLAQDHVDREVVDVLPAARAAILEHHYSVAAVDRVASRPLDDELSCHTGQHEGVGVTEAEQAVELRSGERTDASLVDDDFAGDRLDGVAELGSPGALDRAVRGAREQRGAQVDVRASFAPRNADVDDEQPGAPGGCQHLGGVIECGPGPGGPVGLAVGGPVPLRVDPVVLEVHRKERRSAGIEVHGTG